MSGIGLEQQTKLYPDKEGLATLRQEIEGCQVCTERGYFANSRPLDRGKGSKRILLIGQAPGLGEGERKLSFGGPAGRTLMRWLATTGLSETQVRDYFYLSAITKCYPGRAPKGSGDRNPSPTERTLCRPFLLRELLLVQPELVILVGSTAIKEVYGEKIRLEEIIGQPCDMTLDELYERLQARLIKAKANSQHLPDNLKNWPIKVHHLPHPSGASRWIQLPENRVRLNQALDKLKERFRGLERT
jgi:uracil-DNA glycosylase